MAGTFRTSADACDRETAWLNLPGTVADGLPSLMVVDGGPWDVCQAYIPRTPAMRKSQIFVTRSSIHVERWGFNRTIMGYDMVLKLRWPLSNGAGNAETDQRAFDVAINMLLLRIRGIGANQPGFADKTHNGAFLQVAEGSEVTATRSGIHVEYVDPEHTITAGVDFQATVTYSADDRDFTD